MPHRYVVFLTLFFATLFSDLVRAQSIPRPTQPPPFHCGTSDTELTPALRQLMVNLSRDTSRTRARLAALPRLEVQIGVDVDYLFYQQFGGRVDRIRRYVYERVAEASVVYEKELNLKLTVTHLKIWNQQDPFTRNNNLSQHLSDVEAWWRQNMQAVRRDFVLSFSGKQDPTNSGIGYLGNGRFAEAAVVRGLPGAWYYNFVTAHEIGHVMGSPHTHSCSWPNGPLDFCSAVEGSCYQGTTERQLGTIMSYCGVSSQTFHPLCIELMRGNADRSGLRAIDSPPTTPTPETTQLTTQQPNPILYWLPAERAERYRFQLAESESFSAVQIDTVVAYQQMQAFQLKSGSAYVWRVRAINALGESGWSAPGRISVEPVTALPEPTPKYPAFKAVGVTTNRLEWYPVEGATGYKVQMHWYGEFDYYTPTEVTITGGTSTTAAVSFDADKVWWRVKALKDGAESNWSDTWVYSMALLSPALSSSDMALPKRFPLSFPLSWNDWPDADEFPATVTWKVFRKTSPQQPVLTRTLTYNTPGVRYLSYPLVMFDSLQPNTDYVFRGERLLAGQQRGRYEGSFSTGDDMRQWSFLNGANTGLPRQNVWAVHHDQTGTAWVATAAGIYQSSDYKNWTAHTTKSTQGVLFHEATGLASDPQNNLYAATAQGLFRWSGNRWELLANSRNTYFTQVASNNRSMLVALASGSKLYRYQDNTLVPIPVTGLAASATIQTIAVTREGHLWATTNTEAQLLGRYDGQTWTWYSRTELGFKDSFIYGTRLVTDTTGAPYVYNIAGYSRRRSDATWEFTSTDQLPDRSLKAMTIGRDNRPIIVTYGGIYTQLTNGTWQPLTQLMPYPFSWDLAVTSDASDRLWLSAPVAAIGIYDPRSIQPTRTPATACPGDALPVSFTTNFSPDPSVRYRAELVDGQGVSLAVTSTSQNTTSVSVSIPPNVVAGTYRLRLIADQKNTSIYGTFSSSFTINALPKASLTTSSATSVCQGSTATLRAEDVAGATYQWLQNGTVLTGVTTATAAVGQAASYAVRVTQNGCTATSPSVAVQVAPLPTVSAASVGSTTVCEGATVRLQASTPTGQRYQWLRDGSAIASATASSFTATQSGQYTVQTTDGAGCSATSAAVPILVDVLPKRITPKGSTTVYAPATVEMEVASVASYTYQWQRDGTSLTDGTANTYVARQSGGYSVKINNVTGCSAQTEALTVTILIALANEPDPIQVTIAPNPTEQLCLISLSQPLTVATTLKLTDASGRTVLEQNLLPGQMKATLQVGKLASGSYFLQLDSDKTRHVRRLIKL